MKPVSITTVVRYELHVVVEDEQSTDPITVVLSQEDLAAAGWVRGPVTARTLAAAREAIREDLRALGGTTSVAAVCEADTRETFEERMARKQVELLTGEPGWVRCYICGRMVERGVHHTGTPDCRIVP